MIKMVDNCYFAKVEFTAVGGEPRLLRLIQHDNLDLFNKMIYNISLFDLFIDETEK